MMWLKSPVHFSSANLSLERITMNLIKLGTWIKKGAEVSANNVSAKNCEMWGT